MMNLVPQDPAHWATKILALMQAVPFQAFSVVMADDRTIPVTRPEYVEVTDDGTYAEVGIPEGSRHVIALEWVTDLVIGGDVRTHPRPSRIADKLRVLQADGPDGPLVLTMHDGRQFSLAGPHQFLVAPDGGSVAVCEQEGGLAVVLTCEITDLAPGA